MWCGAHSGPAASCRVVRFHFAFVAHTLWLQSKPWIQQLIVRRPDARACVSVLIVALAVAADPVAAAGRCYRLLHIFFLYSCRVSLYALADSVSRMFIDANDGCRGRVASGRTIS